MGKKQWGFTLTELATCMAILGAIACFCGPEILEVRSGIQTKAVIAEIISDLQLAKMTAIKEGSFVAVTFSLNGYQAFIDNGSGGGIRGDWHRQSGEKVVAAKTLPGHLTLTNNFSDSRLLFRPTASVWPGTLTVVNSKGSRIAIIVSRVGRIRSE